MGRGFKNILDIFLFRDKRNNNIWTKSFIQSLSIISLIIIITSIFNLSNNRQQMTNRELFRHYALFFTFIYTFNFISNLIISSLTKRHFNADYKDTISKRKKLAEEEPLMLLISSLGFYNEKGYLKGIYKKFQVCVYYDKIIKTYNEHVGFTPVICIEYYFQYGLENYSYILKEDERLIKKYKTNEMIDFTPFTLEIFIKYHKQNLTYKSILDTLNKGIEILESENLKEVDLDKVEQLIDNFYQVVGMED